ncbi:MAG TPA: DUF4440 domain-containing protein [Gemmatimonadales bacterium]|nr:DUF4440 domain-containing protein [Gemmatimonadales bacterium]
MQPFTRALGPIALASAIACSSATTTAGTPATSRAGDEAAIRALDDSIVAAMQARDAAAVSAYYAPDAQLLPPNRRSAMGPQAIRAAWAGDFSLPNIDLTFEPRRIDVAASGDLASDIGTYRVSLDGPAGPVSDTGKYVVVWRKVNGEWKIAADMWNSDLPLPEPAPAAPVVATVGDPTEMEIVGSADLKWAPFEMPGFKPGIQMVVIHGDPSSSGDYTLRLRFPDGYNFPSHWHPNGEHLTVIRGTFKLGMGAREGAEPLKFYKAGDFLYIPGRMPHYGGAAGITEIQLHGMGPFKVELSSQSSSR